MQIFELKSQRHMEGQHGPSVQFTVAFGPPTKAYDQVKTETIFQIAGNPGSNEEADVTLG